MLEPVDGDPNKTKCTFIAELDIKGSIPLSLVKKGNLDQAYQVYKIRNVMTKYLKENP